MKYLVLLIISISVFADIKNEGNVVELTADNFNSIVLESKQEVLVKFFAPWCGHCKNMAGAYKTVANRLRDNENILIAEMDWTQHKTDAVEIKGFPTLIFFKKREEKIEQIKFQGPRTTEAMIEFISKNQRMQIEDL